MVHYNQLRGLLLFLLKQLTCISSTRRPLHLRLCRVTLYSALNIGPVHESIFPSVNTMVHISLPLGGYELLSHIYTQHNHSLQNTKNITLFPAHTLKPLCVWKESYSPTHIENNPNHKTNMPGFVCLSFYLFSGYDHHMYSILTLARPEHCPFVRPCRSSVSVGPVTCFLPSRAALISAQSVSPLSWRWSGLQKPVELKWLSNPFWWQE